MFFEKQVNSFPKLLKEVDLLDLDSGIRTFGDYNGKRRQFVFVTRSPDDGYTLMVFEKKDSAGKSVPGKRLFVREFKTKEDLEESMRKLLSKPVTAFIY